MNAPRIVSDFIKSTYSGATANDCLEVAHTADNGRAIRDSKRRDHGTQHYSPTAWAAFLTTVKSGLGATNLRRTP
jgi:uncharacterized protein DUF397